MGILNIKHNTGGYLPILAYYFMRLLYPLKWSAPHPQADFRRKGKEVLHISLIFTYLRKLLGKIILQE
jgi:hypothetical protein